MLICVFQSRFPVYTAASALLKQVEKSKTSSASLFLYTVFPMKRFTECMGNKLNMPQIWLHGFELAANQCHHCNHSSKLEQTIFLKKCAKIVCIAKLMKNFFLTVHCVSARINE